MIELFFIQSMAFIMQPLLQASLGKPPHEQRSQVALDQHATLEDLALLQLLPSVDSTDLNTDHVLVTVLWREVSCSLCLLDPRVPGDGVLDVVASDIEARLAILQDACGIDLDVLVYAVDLAIELEGRFCLCVGGCVEDLVDVFYTAETVDCDL